MKRLLFIIFILLSTTCYAQSWGSGGSDSGGSFFDQGNKTQVIVGDSDSSKENSKNTLTGPESTWNFDAEGLAYIMPDQPAKPRFGYAPLRGVLQRRITRFAQHLRSWSQAISPRGHRCYQCF